MQLPLSSLSDAELHQRWRATLRARLRGSAEPLFAHHADLVPAASLWVMLRHRVEELRTSDDTGAILLSEEASISELVHLLAGLWLGRDLSFFPEMPGLDPEIVTTPALLRHERVNPLNPDQPSTMAHLDTNWLSPTLLREQVLPAILNAEIIVLGSCCDSTWEAIGAALNDDAENPPLSPSA